MRARKIDSNQNEVVKGLRCIPGVSVAVTSSLGDSFPDLVIGYKGVNFLMEVKDGKKFKSQRKLRPGQQEFFSTWKGTVHKIESLDEAVKVLFGK